MDRHISGRGLLDMLKFAKRLWCTTGYTSMMRSFFSSIAAPAQITSFCLPSSTLSQLCTFPCVFGISREFVCKYTLAGLPHDDESKGWIPFCVTASPDFASEVGRHTSSHFLVFALWDCLTVSSVRFLYLHCKGKKGMSSFHFRLVASPLQRKERSHSRGLHYKSTLEHPAARFLKGWTIFQLLILA